MVPVFIGEDALKDGRRVEVLRQYSPWAFGLYALRQSRQFTPARVRRLIEFLEEQFRGG